MRRIDAQLRYYMGLDPDTLSDEEWGMAHNELLWVRAEEKERSQ